MPAPQWPVGQCAVAVSRARPHGRRRAQTRDIPPQRSPLRPQGLTRSPPLSLCLLNTRAPHKCLPACTRPSQDSSQVRYYSLYSRSRVMAAYQHALGTYVLRAAATGRRRPLLCALDHGEARPVHRHWPAVTWVCEAHTRTKQAGCEKTAGSSAKGGARLSLSRPNKQRACTVLCCA